MATQTANLGLTLPIGSEKVKRQVINSNNEIIDAAVGKIEDGIAYRLGETNTTGATLAVGTYVYVSGNSTLAEGLYTVSTAIGTGITLNASNCTAVSGGGLNALNSNLANIHKIVELGGVTSLDISNRTIYTVYHFTFTSGTTGNPFTNAGGHGYLYVNETVNYGSMIVYSNAGIKARKLAGGSYASTWETIVSL